VAQRLKNQYEAYFREQKERQEEREKEEAELREGNTVDPQNHLPKVSAKMTTLSVDI